MRVQRQYTINVPIPPALPPAAVVATLQSVNPVIRNLGTLSRFERTEAGAEPVATDPFFDTSLRTDGQNGNVVVMNGAEAGLIGSSRSGSFSGAASSASSPGSIAFGEVASYQIFELITLAPGLTKEVTYPAYFQRTSEGVRCRANGTAGITGWCEFVVRPRRYPDSPDGSSISASPPSSFGDADEFELFETLVVEANSLLMPFVCQTMEVAHRGLCDKVIKEAAERYAQVHGWDYHQLGRN
jgi:hypothetical protein